MLSRHREIAPLASLEIEGSDVCIVAGAYKGDTIAFLRQFYDCVVVGYEPQVWAYEECKARFANDRKVYLFNYGLGTQSGTFPMGEVGNDAASFVPDPAARTHGEGELTDIVFALGVLIDGDVMYMGKPAKLALFNMEGYEYELLEHMSEKGIMQAFDSFIIQFHDLERMDIQQAVETLSKTHHCRWNFQPSNAWSWTWWEKA